MSSFSKFAGYLKKYKKQAIVAPLCMILVVVGDLAQPYLTQKIIDNGIQTGNLIVRLTNDITQLQNFVMQAFRILIRSPFTGIGALILAVKTSLKLSLIIVSLIAIVVITLFIVIKKSFPLFINSQQALDNLNRALNEKLSGIRAVKAFVREDFEIEKFHKKI